MRKLLALSLLLASGPARADVAAPAAAPVRDQLQGITAMPPEAQGPAIDGNTNGATVAAEAPPGVYIPPPSHYIPPPPGYVPPPAGYAPYQPPPPGYWHPYRPYRPVSAGTLMVYSGVSALVIGGALALSAAPIAGAIFAAIGIGLLIAGLSKS